MSLHFCSFLIVPNLEGAANLVFEATFDGSLDDFLDDLLNVALPGIHAIYEHCVGYPATGQSIPALMAGYLRDNNAGATAFFTGSAGRSVSQIRGEQRLRDQVAAHFDRSRSSGESASTFVELQRQIQREVIRRKRENQWAEQRCVMPREVRWRVPTALALGLAAILAASLLGLLVLLACQHLFAHPDHRLSVFGLYDFVGEFVASARGRFPIGAAVLPFVAVIMVWVALRALQFLLQQENPRHRGFWTRFFVHLLVIVRHTALLLFAGFAVLALNTAQVQRGDFNLWSWGQLALGLLGAALTLGVLQYCATSLKLKIQFRELSKRAEHVRRLLLDVIHFIMVIVLIAAVIAVAIKLAPTLLRHAGQYVFPVVQAAVVFVLCAATGILTAYCCGAIVFNLIRLREFSDRRRFGSAAELTTLPIDAAAYDNEEGGVHRHQNHIASVTDVKPGFLRAILLRATLTAVGLLARFWFNQGNLGGIPTILAARWTLINGGKQVLFLSNYGGAWDSYLNEFIDMGAVVGLNGIWTNTFLSRSDRSFGFPATYYYFWEGAQDERSFKSYVRHSQLETLVWYGAYPRLTVININNNTALRQALFQPLQPCEFDTVLLKAGL
ncbi:MAG: hypothetical protein QOD74_1215 [Variibacter sp.]|jgi:hypothetical protein|nr:hypothetical protein [Variibacter sp.]